MSAGTQSGLAREFARSYVELVEALLREGVEEDIARQEARMSALALYAAAREQAGKTYDPARGPCPTCRRG